MRAVCQWPAGELLHDMLWEEMEQLKGKRCAGRSAAVADTRLSAKPACCLLLLHLADSAVPPMVDPLPACGTRGRQWLLQLVSEGCLVCGAGWAELSAFLHNIRYPFYGTEFG